MITALNARGDVNPKLTLARSLDIPSESRWLAKTRRSTARHRVIARFARERLWDQIWSLNWDCWQESALENVGIKRDGVDEQLLWPTLFHAFITAAEAAAMGETDAVKVIKPHGCVTALVKAEQEMDDGNFARSRELADRFLITSSELARLAPTHAPNGTEIFIFATLVEKLSTLPFAIAGWSASEQYLLDRIGAEVQPILAQRVLKIDELCVIDIAFNNEGHTRLAGFYNKDKDTAYIDVSEPEFGTDALFLWLQALYAVRRLKLSALDDDDRASLDDLAAQIDQPPTPPPFVITWADSFLPVWVRLCWRCGLVKCRNKMQEPVSPNDIKLESRDEHIPWSLPGIERPELNAASRFLAALHRSTRGDDWDFECFRAVSFVIITW